MSLRKPHVIRIVLDIHAVTCPGVWLCQNGKVEVSFSALDYHFRSQPLPPRFPLFMHETFKMEGSYSDPAATVVALERLLANESIEFALWQNGRRLASYAGRMGVLLDRPVAGQPTAHPTETYLIMTPSSCFPGSIAPKIELLAIVEIIETCRTCKAHVARTLRRPVSRALSEPIPQKIRHAKRLHQRPVCHSRPPSRNYNYWRQHFEPSMYLDDYAYTARFCDNCVDRLSPSMEGDAFLLTTSKSPCHSGNAIRNSPNHFDCGHSHAATINVGLIHPKTCDICFNYRTYFKLLSNGHAEGS